MGLIHDLQTSFAGGELAPDLQGRVDLAKYKTGLRTCRNAIPYPHGPVSNRPGTYFTGMTKFTDKRSRLIPFVFSSAEAYALEFGDQYIRVYKDGGLVLENVYDYTVQAWSTRVNYAIGDYVLATGFDDPGYSIHLFKSIKYFNLGYTPLNSPTYWEDMGYVDPWDVGETYNTDDVVSKVRTADGKTKTFISLIDNNIGIDPLDQGDPWDAVLPNWDDEVTYAADDYVVVAVASGGDYDHFRFKSLQAGNLNKNPLTEPTWWDLDQPESWNAGTTYDLDDWVQHNSEWIGDYALWDDSTVYALNDHVRVIDGYDQYLFRSNYDENVANDPLDPQTWWNLTSLPWWSSGTTYDLDDWVIRGVWGEGWLNWYRYKSLQNNNIGKDPLTEPTWWVLDQPDTWDDEITYGIGDYVQAWIGGRWLIYQSGLAGNLNHNPANSGPAWSDVTPIGTGNFRLYQSGIANNLNHNPADPYAGVSWEEIVNPMGYEVSTPYLEADLPGLKFAQSADSLYLVHPDYPPMVLQRFSDNEWELNEYEFKNGPFMFPNTDEDKTFSLAADFSITAFFDYFTMDEKNRTDELLKFNVVRETRVAFKELDVLDEVTSSLMCGGSWRLLTSGTWVGTIILEKSNDNGSTWETVESWTSKTASINVNAYGTIDNDGEPFLIRVKMSDYTSGTAETTLKADAFNFSIIGTVTDIVDSTHATLNVLFPAETGLLADVLPITITSDWEGGSWSDYNGWPSAITFCQDRLVFAATASEPQTIWMTKSGNYLDFGRSSPLIDSDGITINLTSREFNRVKSLRSFLNSFIAFTESSEYSIGAENAGPITPTTVLSKLQGLRGSADADPVMIGNRIVFSQPRGTAIRDMLYQVLTDSFDSENISILASHLLKGREILEMAYQQEPDSLLWMVLDDGTLLSLTYLREQEMLAWSWHDTDGLFESICTIPGDGLNEIWFVVNRGGRRFIEKMTQRVDSTDPADQYFVDCGISYDGSAVSALSGFDHLNEKTVAINADGFVLAPQPVVDGVVDLPATGEKTTYSKVHIGLPFVSDVETLNPEVALRNGPSFGRKYRINKIQFRFLNSRGGWIGADADNLTDELDQRDPGLDADEPTPLFTGYDEYTLPQSESKWGHVMYRQVDPMPFTILGILSLIDFGENP